MRAEATTYVFIYRNAKRVNESSKQEEDKIKNSKLNSSIRIFIKLIVNFIFPGRGGKGKSPQWALMAFIVYKNKLNMIDNLRKVLNTCIKINLERVLQL